MAADLILLMSFSSYRDNFAVCVCSRFAAFARTLSSGINVTLGGAAAPSAITKAQFYCFVIFLGFGLVFLRIWWRGFK